MSTASSFSSPSSAPSFASLLASAWELRERSGIFKHTDALRVFHGPGEAPPNHPLHSFAVDRFQNHYWITQWESNPAQNNSAKNDPTQTTRSLTSFYRTQNAQSIVCLNRPSQGTLPTEPMILWGEPPTERIPVKEYSNQFLIQLTGARHPGLFLDHLPLRQWLEQNVTGLRVLNTFSYTGSLSVAAHRGNASAVTTIDLSPSTIEISKQNIELNDFQSRSNRWYSGDIFEWLPRWKKAGETFDCIILDPPSFSHGSRRGKSSFSTQKDLTLLHAQAIDILADKGFLITSINSANVTWQKFQTDLLAAACSRQMTFQIIRQLDLPETFPTLFGTPQDRYLKGWILKRI